MTDKINNNNNNELQIVEISEQQLLEAIVGGRDYVSNCDVDLMHICDSPPQRCDCVPMIED